MAQKEQHNLQQGHGQVELVEDLGGGLNLGHQAADRGPRAFRPHQIHLDVSCGGKEGDQKDQNAHAADPVGKAAPENDAPRHDLHVGDDAGASGGKSGHSFEHGVHRIGKDAAENEGQGSHQAHDDPA